MDQSGSINVENFEKVKNFILGVIAGFNASREGTHIGIIKYSTDATTVLRFNEFDDPNFDYENLNQTLQNALDLPSGGKTRIDLALRKADRDLFSGPSKYRTFVPKVRNETFIINDIVFYFTYNAHNTVLTLITNYSLYFPAILVRLPSLNSAVDTCNSNHLQQECGCETMKENEDKLLCNSTMCKLNLACRAQIS